MTLLPLLAAEANHRLNLSILYLASSNFFQMCHFCASVSNGFAIAYLLAHWDFCVEAKADLSSNSYRQKYWLDLCLYPWSSFDCASLATHQRVSFCPKTQFDKLRFANGFCEAAVYSTTSKPMKLELLVNLQLLVNLSCSAYHWRNLRPFTPLIGFCRDFLEELFDRCPLMAGLLLSALLNGYFKRKKILWWKLVDFEKGYFWLEYQILFLLLVTRNRHL